MLDLGCFQALDDITDTICRIYIHAWGMSKCSIATGVI